MDNIFSDTPFYGVLSWITLIYILFVGVLPWTGGPQRGTRGVLVRTGTALLVLTALCVLVLAQCSIGYCGHGAMVLPALVALGAVAGAITLISAALAWYQWRR